RHHRRSITTSSKSVSSRSSLPSPRTTLNHSVTISLSITSAINLPTIVEGSVTRRPPIPILSWDGGGRDRGGGRKPLGQAAGAGLGPGGPPGPWGWVGRQGRPAFLGSVPRGVTLLSHWPRVVRPDLPRWNTACLSGNHRGFPRFHLALHPWQGRAK